jgi:large subunit ribosomal protein L6
MSRIGNREIQIPEGVKVEIDGQNVVIKNAKDQQSFVLPNVLSVKIDHNSLTLERDDDSKETKSLHGTYARLVSNSILGLSEGFVKNLEYKGVGFTVSVSDNKLVMRLGFSHQIEIDIPDGLEVLVQKNVISIKGTDKDQVGSFAAKVREVKKPEVYKGKGIRYQNENVKKKAGKAAQSATT